MAMMTQRDFGLKEHSAHGRENIIGSSDLSGLDIKGLCADLQVLPERRTPRQDQGSVGAWTDAPRGS